MTLLRLLAGLDEPDSGIVTRRQGLRTKLLRQSCELDTDRTIEQILFEAGAEIRRLLGDHDALLDRLSDSNLSDAERVKLQHRYDELHHTLEVHRAWDYTTDVKRIQMALNLPDPDRALRTLSGGELRRVDLAATLLAQPDVLLLDEPTNHIDTTSAEWIEQFLATYDGSCILVTHDRYFLELVVSRIVELEFNRLYSFPGNYEKFLEYKATILDVEAKTEQSRQGTLRRELEWMRRGPKARGTKQKARIKRYEDLDAQGPPEAHKEPAFQIPEPPRLGKRILEVESLRFSYGDVPVIDDLTFIMQKGMRIGVVGPNGSGKTTLLRLIMGEIENYKGRITVGDTTEFLYVDQLYADINPDQSVIDFVTGGGNFAEVNGRRVFVPGYLETMLFDRDTVRSPMRNLSGGERNRVVLAKKLLRGGNVLVLDEPTNDLDLATLRVIEEAILAFDGCAILVSHDRYFLNRLSTHILSFEGNGEVLFLAGNYDDYQRYTRETAQAAAEPTNGRAAAPAPRREANPDRLTYQEKQELKSIEATIESVGASCDRIGGADSGAGFLPAATRHGDQRSGGIKSPQSTAWKNFTAAGNTWTRERTLSKRKWPRPTGRSPYAGGFHVSHASCRYTARARSARGTRPGYRAGPLEAGSDAREV
jgi:ABC transport system ATP-binding/permease protein